MAARVIPFDFGRGFARLQTIRSLFNNAAELAFGILRTSGVTADAQTVTIGTDVIEIDTLATAVTPTLTVADGTATQLTLTAHGITQVEVDALKGAALPIKCETEIIHVIQVVDANTVRTKRGRSGTTAAAHTAAAVTKAACTAGRIALGVLSTSADDFETALEAEINANDRGTDTGIAGLVAAKNLTADYVVVSAKAVGNKLNGRATTETMTNGAWDAATMSGGTAEIRRRVHTISIVPTAAQVTAGRIDIPVDMAVTGVVVGVRTTATGLAVAWNGNALVTPKSGAKPAIISIDNAGATDWSVNETITIIATE